LHTNNSSGVEELVERYLMSDSSKERRNDPGIATEEWFLDEIMSLCLVITLTILDELRKIRGIHGTKEKTTSELSSFGRH
jgi:hypothetical protein